MDLRQLGKSGLYVSKLSLGTMTLGEADESSSFHGIGCPKDEAFKIIDLALESGINFIDTANIYGQDGMVEKLLGDYFSDRRNRKNIILATKFRFSMGKLAHQKGASRRHILEAVEDSLRRLKTDFIDLYQIHMQDLNTPEEETLRALDDLVRQGKVRYIGASNYAAYRFLDALYESQISHLERYCSLQMQYSMLCRDIEFEHIPLCLKHGVGILAWSPLAGGFLSGKYAPDQNHSGSRFSIKKEWGSRFHNDKNWAIMGVVANIAKEINASSSQVALAWLLQKPAVSSVIIGARKVSQLTDNLQASKLTLSEEHLNRLETASALASVYPYNFMYANNKSS